MDVELFDKIINIDLIANDGKVSQIICPNEDIKPNISISGTFSMGSLVTNLSLKITNLYLNRPMSDYSKDVNSDLTGYIQITAGYRNTLVTTIFGECFNSFQDKPSPDGDATFEVMTGQFQDWISQTMNGNYSKTMLLSSVLKEVAIALNMNLKIAPSITQTIGLDLNFNGYAKDFCYKLKQCYPNLIIRPDGKDLIVFEDTTGTNIWHTIKYFSNAKKDAGTFTINAPWNPSIRPGDNIQVDPLFFKASFGAQVVNTDKFLCISEDFSFATNDDVNEMTLTLTPVK
jgi:hypothetical protein